MKNSIILLLTISLLSGCAAIKGSISVNHKGKTESKIDSNSIKKIDSLKNENTNLKSSLDERNSLLTQNNIHTKKVEDELNLKLSGFTTSEGSKVNFIDGLKPSSVSQTLTRGRITAIGTYFYINDSISIKLIVIDTNINIHRKTTTIDDKNKSESDINLHKTSDNNSNKYTASSFENKSFLRNETNKETGTEVKTSFSASIGISNWIPVIIALIIGLTLGIALGRKSKK